MIWATWGGPLDFWFRALSTKHLGDGLFHSEKGLEKDTTGSSLKSTVRGGLVGQPSEYRALLSDWVTSDSFLPLGSGSLFCKLCGGGAAGWWPVEVRQTSLSFPTCLLNMLTLLPMWASSLSSLM